MSKNIITLVFICLSTIALSNISFPPDSSLNMIKKAEVKLLISEGKKYYSTDQYRLALVKFREALTVDKKSAEANYWISECHIELKNFDVALKYAKKAESINSSVSKELYYVMGQAQHRLGDLDRAIDSYSLAIELLSKSRVKDYRLGEKIEECKRAKAMVQNGRNIKISALGSNINSKNDDYSPVLTDNGKTLYFSARKAENEGGGFSSGDNKYFSDIFVSYWDEKSNQWSKASNTTQTISVLNSKGFDDIAFITHDGKKLYYSVNTEGVVDAKINTQSTDIYYSVLEDKQWGTPQPIDKKHINSLYFDASPTFTQDGNTMYFVSERLGGQGRADIWVSRKSKGQWSKAENIGDKINTPFQETTVFVTPDGKYLFFSSEGHDGMGGYDVYVTKNIDGEWSAPVNLGYPINNVSDETHFVFYPELNKAFYSKESTKKNKGIGRRDIFEIDMSDFNIDKLF